MFVATTGPASASRYEKSCFFTAGGQKKWCEFAAAFNRGAYYWEGWCNSKIYKGVGPKQRSYVFAMGDGRMDGGGG